MTPTQRLEQLFGVTFQQQPSLKALRQFHSKNTFCTNEKEEIIGLFTSENDWDRLNIPKDLQQLQYLNLSDNKSLSSLTFEAPLPALTHLDVSDCQLAGLELPAGFKQLKWIDLSRNQLQKIHFEGGLPALWYLDLTQNQIPELTLRARQLKNLYLNDNALNQLQFAAIPADLEVLQLRNNQLQQLPEHFLSLDQLKTLYVHGNPLSDIPAEVVGRGEHYNALEEIQSFLLSLEKSGGQKEYLHQAKMVLVGNGEVGKTSIRIKLLDKQAPLPKKKERTAGLDLATYMVSELDPALTLLSGPIDFQLNIWDFGGQGKYREIQQLFCSRKSLYLFVTAPDDDPKKEHYVGFEYWLSMVNAYSYDEQEEQHSPVIHVVNKIDQAEKFINQEELHAEFPNMAAFVKISCLTLEKFEDLEAAIRKTLPKVSKDIFTDQYSPDWMAVKAALEELQEDHHITYDTYLEICGSKNLDETEARSWLRILNRIGTVIYFGNNEELKDWIILDAQWVKEALFQIMDASSIVNGLLRPEHLPGIWAGYDPEERQKLLALMKAYELCYEQKDGFGNPEYIVPELLSAVAPQMPAHLGAAQFEIKFDYAPFIPAGTVNKLMVRLNKQIYSHFKWKNHVILHDPQTNAFAHVWEDWENKVVYLDLYGEEVRSLYHQILHELSGVTERYKNTRFIHQLDFKAQACYQEQWVEVDMLKNFKDVQDLTFLWEQEGRPAALGWKNWTRPQRVYFSYAWGDDQEEGESREKIVNELYNALVADGFEVIRDKTDLGYGDLISEFMKAIGQGDLIVVFVSEKYIQSPNCMFELYEIARNNKWDKQLFSNRILPVPVESIPLHNPEILEKYFSYWEEEQQKWANFITKRINQVSMEQKRRHDQVKEIFQEFGNLADWLVDINGSNTKLLSKNDFALIKAAILNRLDQLGN